MNIAEILKYCPKGTKLYSLVDGEVTLKKVTDIGACPILVEVKDGTHKYYTRYGLHFTSRSGGECVLFPSKDQRDWKKFMLPVKRGDVMMLTDSTCPFIATGELHNDISFKYICGIDLAGNFQKSYGTGGWTSEFCIPASEEARKKLFDKIAEAGYKWNADSLKLEIKHEFNEGDVLTRNNTLFLFTGIIIDNLMLVYCLCSDGTFITCSISPSSVKLASITGRNKLVSAMVKGGYRYDTKQHILVLVDAEQKFKPFDKVLVRDFPSQKWSISLFSYYDKENISYPYVCLNSRYSYCIPYKGHECLVGTTINPPHMG